MTDTLMLVGDISTAVKVGWLVWVVWAGALVAWYRYGRVEVMVPLPAPRPRAESRTSSVVIHKPSTVASAKSTASLKPLSSVSKGGSPEFLAALGLDTPKDEEPAPSVTTPGESVYS